MQKDKNYFETMIGKYQELNNPDGIKAMRECLLKYDEQKNVMDKNSALVEGIE